MTDNDSTTSQTDSSQAPTEQKPSPTPKKRAQAAAKTAHEANEWEQTMTMPVKMGDEADAQAELASEISEPAAASHRMADQPEPEAAAEPPVDKNGKLAVPLDTTGDVSPETAGAGNAATAEAAEAAEASASVDTMPLARQTPAESAVEDSEDRETKSTDLFSAPTESFGIQAATSGSPTKPVTAPTEPVTTPIAYAAPAPGPAMAPPTGYGNPALAPTPIPAPMAPTANKRHRGPRAWTIIWGLLLVMVGLDMVFMGNQLASGHAYNNFNIGVIFIVFLCLAGVALLVTALVAAVRNRR